MSRATPAKKPASAESLSSAQSVGVTPGLTDSFVLPQDQDKVIKEFKEIIAIAAASRRNINKQQQDAAEAVFAAESTTENPTLNETKLETQQAQNTTKKPTPKIKTTTRHSTPTTSQLPKSQQENNLDEVKSKLLSHLNKYVLSRQEKLNNPSFFSRLFFDPLIAKAKIKCANAVIRAIKNARTIDDCISAVSSGIENGDYALARKYSTVDTYGGALVECQKILKPYKKPIDVKPVKNNTVIKSVAPKPVDRLDFF